MKKIIWNNIMPWVIVIALCLLALVSVPTCTVLVVGPMTAGSVQYGV